MRTYCKSIDNHEHDKYSIVQICFLTAAANIENNIDKENYNIKESRHFRYPLISALLNYNVVEQDVFYILKKITITNKKKWENHPPNPLGGKLSGQIAAKYYARKG